MAKKNGKMSMCAVVTKALKKAGVRVTTNACYEQNLHVRGGEIKQVAITVRGYKFLKRPTK